MLARYLLQPIPFSVRAFIYLVPGIFPGYSFKDTLCVKEAFS